MRSSSVDSHNPPIGLSQPVNLLKSRNLLIGNQNVGGGPNQNVDSLTNSGVTQGSVLQNYNPPLSKGSVQSSVLSTVNAGGSYNKTGNKPTHYSSNEPTNYSGNHPMTHSSTHASNPQYSNVNVHHSQPHSHHSRVTRIVSRLPHSARASSIGTTIPAPASFGTGTLGTTSLTGTPLYTTNTRLLGSALTTPHQMNTSILSSGSMSARKANYPGSTQLQCSSFEQPMTRTKTSGAIGGSATGGLASGGVSGALPSSSLRVLTPQTVSRSDDRSALIREGSHTAVTQRSKEDQKHNSSIPMSSGKKDQKSAPDSTANQKSTITPTKTKIAQHPTKIAQHPNAPLASGPLFQCAVCQGLVYESQLEFHLTICKDDKKNTTQDMATSPIKEMKSDKNGSDKNGSSKNLNKAASGGAPTSNANSQKCSQKLLKLDHHQKPINLFYNGAAGGVGSAQVSNTTRNRGGRSANSLASSLSPRLHSQGLLEDLRVEKGDQQQRAVNGMNGVPVDGMHCNVEEIDVEMNYNDNVTGMSDVKMKQKGKEFDQSPKLFSPDSLKNMSSGLRESIKLSNKSKWNSKRRSFVEQVAEAEKNECTFKPNIRRSTVSPVAKSRKADRMDEIRRQKERKEIEECTFRPQTNEELNRHILTTRSDNFDEVCKNYEDDKQLRRQQMERAQSHPFRPTISEYAKKHGGGHSHRFLDNEMFGNNGDFMNNPMNIPYDTSDNVYDRLYSAFTIAQTAKTGILDERQNGQGRGINNLSDAERGAKLLRTRATPTSELLYSDALDRRRRLQERQELGPNGGVEQQKVKKDRNSGILAKSRRYYWSLLEKQVRDAFLVATRRDKEDFDRDLNGSDQGHHGQMLLFEDLDRFLAEMGCLNPKKERERHRVGITQDAPVTASNYVTVEEQKMKMSLWKHLDPDNIGATDLFTLTVFFHVLTGAVDEVTLKNIQEEAHNQQQQASISYHGPSADGTNDGIAHFGSKNSKNSTGTGDDSHRGDEVERQINSASNVGLQKLQSLAERFNPQKLRKEFYGLYCNRMHYQSTNGSTNDNANSSSKPERIVMVDGGKNSHQSSRNQVAVSGGSENQSNVIGQTGHHIITSDSSPGSNKNVNQKKIRGSATMATQGRDIEDRVSGVEGSSYYSKVLADNVHQRLQKESGKANHVDLLLWRHQRSMANRESQRQKKQEQESKECTFQPRTRSGKILIQGERNKHAELYRNGVIRKEAHLQKIRVEQERKAQKELDRCSFKPDLTKSIDSYNDKYKASLEGRMFQDEARKKWSDELRPNYFPNGVGDDAEEGVDGNGGDDHNGEDPLGDTEYLYRSEDPQQRRSGSIQPPGFFEITQRMRKGNEQRNQKRQFEEQRIPTSLMEPLKAYNRKVKEQLGNDVFLRVSDKYAAKTQELSKQARKKQYSPERELERGWNKGTARSVARSVDRGAREKPIEKPIPPRKNRVMDQEGSHARMQDSSQHLSNSYTRKQQRESSLASNNRSNNRSTKTIASARDPSVRDRDSKGSTMTRSKDVIRASGQQSKNSSTRGGRNSLGGSKQSIGGASRNSKNSSMRASSQGEDVLLFVDVNITPTTTERLIVYRDQSPEEASRLFAQKHGLTNHLANKLNYLLTAQLEALEEGKQ